VTPSGTRVLDPVHVRAPDLGGAIGTVEALAHDERDPFLAGEHVDRLDLHVVARREGARRLDVAPGRVASSQLAGVRRAAGDVDHHVVGEEREGPLPVAGASEIEVAAHEVADGHRSHIVHDRADVEGLRGCPSGSPSSSPASASSTR
jgi:hypothetical protein